jgi:cytidylate kinase
MREAVERYLRSARYETGPRRAPSPGREEVRPVITISRQAGAGAHAVAEELAGRLQPSMSRDAPPWTIFDRDLVDRVLEDHDLPARLAAFMPEDAAARIAETVDQLFGVHPPSWVLVRKTADTILRLAHIGNAIVIGRGGNMVTAGLPFAFHVRLIGSVDRRTQYLQEHLHLDSRGAKEYLRAQDLGRGRYVRTYYGADIDDPLRYHLVINTDRVPYPEAAQMIAEAVSALMGSGGRVALGPAAVASAAT